MGVLIQIFSLVTHKGFPYKSVCFCLYKILFYFCYMVLDVIGQAIDIGDIQLMQVQGKETKKMYITLTDT